MSQKDHWTYNDFLDHYAGLDAEKLLPTLAHDIRNQLSTIVGYVELMHMDASRGVFNDADKQNFFEAIVERTHTISMLLDATLAVDHQQRGAGQPHQTQTQP